LAIAFDDEPKGPGRRGRVALVGAFCSRTRLDGVVVGRVRRDGADSTRRMIELVRGSGYPVRAVLLQGIAVAGFNVVDVQQLHDELGVPVVVVMRRPPDLAAIERALLRRVPGGARKWRLIQRAAPPEPLAGLYVQRVGIDRATTEALLVVTRLHGKLPEPIRLAHLIAGALGTGRSRGRA
jgi:endonuclease V-like protein UPF0215 family